MKYSMLTSMLTSAVYATTISEITGSAWRSPLDGKTVSGLNGIVTAKGPQGFWIRAKEADNDPRTSESLYVFTNAKSPITGNVTVGDEILIDGKVADYRSDKNFVFLTELTTPTNIRVVSKDNAVKPITLGKELSPPAAFFTALDKVGGGGIDVFGVPNNSTQLTVANPPLQPREYGMDFWKSLCGELVEVKAPKAISKLTKYGEIWTYGGDWKVTGKNQRGGLTMMPGKGKNGADSNPEAVMIGAPLDGTKNPDITIGDGLSDFTGVVTQQFGAPYILPLTAVKVTKPNTKVALPTSLQSNSKCFLTFGNYNIENFAPTDADHVADIAHHIAKFMRSPDIVFVQEVQDSNGATNDGVVDSDKTLSALSDAIVAAGGKKYSFTYISPANNQDGGQPGGNIRVAYLYNPLVVELVKAKVGGANDANEVLTASTGGPTLKYNPGRIAPSDPTWGSSRKPLVAEWKVLTAPNKKKTKSIFTINVHFASKGGSSPLGGDLRPPVNKGVDQRLAQATLTANFAKQILAKDRDAHVIVAGDMNEFSMVSPLKVFNGILDEIDEVVETPEEERYSYTFGQTMQALDHMFISPALGENARFEHVHVNTWVTYKNQVSDHDPSVAKLKVCDERPSGGFGYGGYW